MHAAHRSHRRRRSPRRPALAWSRGGCCARSAAARPRASAALSRLDAIEPCSADAVDGVGDAAAAWPVPVAMFATDAGRPRLRAGRSSRPRSSASMAVAIVVAVGDGATAATTAPRRGGGGATARAPLELCRCATRARARRSRSPGLVRNPRAGAPGPARHRGRLRLRSQTAASSPAAARRSTSSARAWRRVAVRRDDPQCGRRRPLPRQLPHRGGHGAPRRSPRGTDCSSAARAVKARRCAIPRSRLDCRRRRVWPRVAVGRRPDARKASASAAASS